MNHKKGAGATGRDRALRRDKEGAGSATAGDAAHPAILKTGGGSNSLLFLGSGKRRQGAEKRKTEMKPSVTYKRIKVFHCPDEAKLPNCRAASFYSIPSFLRPARPPRLSPFLLGTPFIAIFASSESERGRESAGGAPRLGYLL